MAAVNFTRGVKLAVLVGDGEDPEGFAPLCTINAERGVSFDGTFRDEVIPDCADPDLMGWVSREAESLSMTVTGGGMNAKEDNSLLWTWWSSGEAKRVRIELQDAVAANEIAWEGMFRLTQFDITGNRGEKVASTMSLSSDGAVTAEFGANVGGA